MPGATLDEQLAALKSKAIDDFSRSCLEGGSARVGGPRESAAHQPLLGQLRAIHTLGSVQGFGHTRPAVLRSAPAGRGRMIDFANVAASTRPRSAGHNCPG